MRRTTPYTLAIAALVGLPVLAAVPASADDHGDSTELMAELSELNDSGGTGTAWGMLTGTELEITLEVSGLLEEAPHAQHIHIGGTNTCPDPNMEGSGFEGAIQTTDGAPAYGGVKVSLTMEPGMTGAEHVLDVANFPVGGSYEYSRTIELDQETADSVMAGDGVIVVHGVDHNDSGAYDGEPMSDLDESLPSEATDPALCGTFDVAQMSMPDGGAETGGGDTSGIENTGAIALGALALTAGAMGMVVSRRRENTTA